jgi:hypothetical protein
VEYLREVKRWVDMEEQAVMEALKKREDDKVGGWVGGPKPWPAFMHIELHTGRFSLAGCPCGRHG